jgi:acyl carrier protein
MERAAIERDVRSFLVDEFFRGSTEELSGDGSLLGTVIDSTGILVLVTYLQERFAIVVEDEDVVPDNLDSVKNVVAYVARKLERKHNN